MQTTHFEKQSHSTDGRVSLADDEWTVKVFAQYCVFLLDFMCPTIDCPGSKFESFDFSSCPKWVPSEWVLGVTLFSKQSPSKLMLRLTPSSTFNKSAVGEVFFWKWEFVFGIALFSFLKQRNHCFTNKTTSDPARSNFFLANLLCRFTLYEKLSEGLAVIGCFVKDIKYTSPSLSFMISSSYHHLIIPEWKAAPVGERAASCEHHHVAHHITLKIHQITLKCFAENAPHNPDFFWVKIAPCKPENMTHHWNWYSRHIVNAPRTIQTVTTWGAAVAEAEEW